MLTYSGKNPLGNDRRAHGLELLALAALLLAGGCTMTPDYARPDAPTPTAWPRGPSYQDAAAPSNAPAAAEIPWRDFFSYPRLQTLIDIALANNRDLRLAALNVEKAHALYGLQRDELYPVVNAAAGGSKQQTSADLTAPDSPRTTQRFDVNLGVASWEIDLFGRIRSLKEQALQEYLATAQAQRGAQIALIAETARVYLMLGADLEKLDLAHATLKMQQGTYDLIKRQYDAQLADEIDLLRARTQVDAARADAARYTHLAAQTRNALDLLAGAPVPDDLLPPSLTAIPPNRDIFAGVPSDTLLQRPDIMAAEHQLQAAYALIGAARAAFFPRISLTTAIGTASDELSGLFGAGAEAWNFTPQIVLPIFDARVWAAHRVSKVHRKILLTQYERAIQAAFREVADALAVRGTAHRQVEAQQAVVDSARKIYELSNKRYANGIDSYLGVLDAQRSLYGAQQALITLRLTKLANEIKLYAALGGGVAESAPLPAGSKE